MLDDEEHRRVRMEEHVGSVVGSIVRKLPHEILYTEDLAEYDVICLDHDMCIADINMSAPCPRPGLYGGCNCMNGTQVARVLSYFVQDGGVLHPNLRVVLHSANNVGVKAMFQILQDAKIPVVICQVDQWLRQEPRSKKVLLEAFGVEDVE